MKQIVRELYSPDGWHKVEIVRRADGLLQVISSSWRYEVVEGYGQVYGPYWAPTPSPTVSLTDTLERAEELAREELRRLSGSPEWTTTWRKPTDPEHENPRPE
jgi:hypothetical protein